MPLLLLYIYSWLPNGASAANTKTAQQKQSPIYYVPAIAAPFLKDTLPKYSTDTIVIPFEYKQSALFQPFTFKAIDSVINILLGQDDVLLSINGYAHVDEAGDSICYYLSLNRALVIKDYVLGRGIDSSRIISLKGWGNIRSKNRKTNAEILRYNCRAEIMLDYPLPPPPKPVNDRDEDGVADEVDDCPDEYGEILKYGCPDRNIIIVPFEPSQYSLFSISYTVLDSVKAVLAKDPQIKISIAGYAYKTEGAELACRKLSGERADIVKRYLLSRGIGAERIILVKGLSKSKFITAGRNPQEIIRNSRAEISLIKN